MKNFTRFLIPIFLLLEAVCLNAQTTIISSSGDGGFETGATFALNNWTATTGTATQNQWVCNTGATVGFSGVRCAYVTNNTAGAPPPHTYTTTATRASHIYRTISVPTGETLISLNFDWINVGEATFDKMRIWLVPTSFTPAYGTAITATGSAPTGRVQVGLTDYDSQSSWSSAATVSIPSAYAGAGNVKLVIEWRNDGSGGVNPPAGIDNISLISSTPPAPPCATTPVPTNAAVNIPTTQQLSWASASGATSYDVYFGNATNPPLVSNVAVTSYNPGALISNTTYYWKVIPKNAAGSAMGCSEWTFTTIGCPGGLGTGVNNITLPYSATGLTTCGKINDLTSSNISNICGSSSYYGAEDEVYVFTPTSTGSYTIFMTTATDDDAGIMLYSGCPVAGGTCVGNAQSTTGLTRTIIATLTSGVTYYLIVDNFPSPSCIGTYTLSITPPAACPAPVSAAATLITSTSAQANWDLTTGTFIVEYGPTTTFGTPGTGAAAGNAFNAVVTATNTNLKVLSSLTPATGYSYVVRQDCSGGGNGYSSNSTVKTFTTLVACPAPVSAAATLITQTSAQANWNLSTGTFIVEYGPTSTFGTPGTGATAGNANNTVVTATNTNLKSLSGLVGSTGYSYVVRQDCTGGSNGYSVNSSTIIFTTLAPPPANDDCVNATSLVCNAAAISGTTVNTVAEPAPPGGCIGQYGVWYQFTGAGNSVTLTTVAGAGFDHEMDVFSGSCGSLTNITCQDVGLSGGTETYTFTATNLTQYYVYIAYYSTTGTSSQTGTFTIGMTCVACTAPVSAAATLITATTAQANWDLSTGTFIVEYGPTSTFGTPGTAASAGNAFNTVVTIVNDNKAPLSGLTSSTGYSYVVRQNCTGAGNGYSANSTVRTFTTLGAPPSNDDPSTPIVLTVGAGCSGAPYTLVNATFNGEPYPSCSGTAVTPVWFSFVAPASGAVRVTTDLGTGTLTDSKVAIFDNSLNIISCDDDGGSTIGSGFLSVVYAFDLIAGDTYKIAVDKYTSATSSGTFCITVSSIATSMIPPTGTCGTGYQTPSSNLNTTYTGWAPLLDNSSRLVAMVRNPAGGDVSAYSVSQYVNTGATRQAGQYYLNRNYLISNSSATNVDVLLPFLATEMDALTASDPASTINSVGVTRVVGTTCTNNFSGGSASFYPQSASNSANGVDWVEFQTPGFSNFFINRSTALPIELKSFTGKTLERSNMLQWETLTEKNVQFHFVERSVDGTHWTEVGRQAGQANSSEPLKYSLEDRAPLAKAYYRLRSVDFDGQESKSNTILLTRKSDHFGITNVFPSPTVDNVTVQFTSLQEETVTVRVLDLTGRLVLTQTAEAVADINELQLQLNGLQAGVYTVTVANSAGVSEPLRFVKQ